MTRTKIIAAAPTRVSRFYHDGTKIPMRAIRRYARRIAECFKPDQIILFGSHAYGTPHADSDVDLLVVMRCRDRSRQAVNIRWELESDFAMDLIVRTPNQLATRLKEGDSFLGEIVNRGKVLYANGDEALGAKG